MVEQGKKTNRVPIIGEWTKGAELHLKLCTEGMSIKETTPEGAVHLFFGIPYSLHSNKGVEIVRWYGDHIQAMAGCKQFIYEIKDDNLYLTAIDKEGQTLILERVWK